MKNNSIVVFLSPGVIKSRTQSRSGHHSRALSFRLHVSTASRLPVSEFRPEAIIALMTFCHQWHRHLATSAQPNTIDRDTTDRLTRKWQNRWPPPSPAGGMGNYGGEVRTSIQSSAHWGHCLSDMRAEKGRVGPLVHHTGTLNHAGFMGQKCIAATCFKCLYS